MKTFLLNNVGNASLGHLFEFTFLVFLRFLRLFFCLLFFPSLLSPPLPPHFPSHTHMFSPRTHQHLHHPAFSLPPSPHQHPHLRPHQPHQPHQPALHRHKPAPEPRVPSVTLKHDAGNLELEVLQHATTQNQQGVQHLANSDTRRVSAPKEVEGTDTTKSPVGGRGVLGKTRKGSSRQRGKRSRDLSFLGPHGHSWPLILEKFCGMPVLKKDSSDNINKKSGANCSRNTISKMNGARRPQNLQTALEMQRDQTNCGRHSHCSLNKQRSRKQEYTFALTPFDAWGRHTMEPQPKSGYNKCQLEGEPIEFDSENFIGTTASDFLLQNSERSGRKTHHT